MRRNDHPPPALRWSARLSLAVFQSHVCDVRVSRTASEEYFLRSLYITRLSLNYVRVCAKYPSTFSFEAGINTGLERGENDLTKIVPWQGEISVKAHFKTAHGHTRGRLLGGISLRETKKIPWQCVQLLTVVGHHIVHELCSTSSNPDHRLEISSCSRINVGSGRMRTAIKNQGSSSLKNDP